MKHSASPFANVSAVIFDVDGTLVDSVDFHAEAWVRTFAAFGVEVSFDDARGQIGKGGDQLMPVFLSTADLEDKGKQIEGFRGDLFKSDYLDRVVGFPKVRELFDRLAEMGVTLALGSSAKGDELEVYKQVAGIDDLDLIETTSEDAERTKPHPDIFEVALESLGISLERVLVVGDTPYDIEAAKKAGIKAIGLLCGGFSEQSLRDAGAIAVYADPARLLDAIDAVGK